MEGAPIKAVVKTQLKKIERKLRGTLSGAVSNMNRSVTQQMTPAQYHEASLLVDELLIQVREEYHDIVTKLEALILSEEQASEEDTTLLRTTEKFLIRLLPEVNAIRTNMVENIPQPERARGPGAEGGPAQTKLYEHCRKGKP